MTYWWKSFIIFIAGLFLLSCASSPVASSKPVSNTLSKNKIIIAIDAGHGGKDPGAIGQNGWQEKTINLAVAKALYDLLDKDPAFSPVMTRKGDYFISVSHRSEIARTQSAHLLVSIHADAAQNNKATGSSVWVLSNKRADSELGRLLEQQEKQSELLGGGGDILGGDVDLYLSHAVIDLQFGYAQRMGYDLASKLLREMKKVGNLHKNKPEHASFGILRSPDIPSVLIEVGFISNSNQEKLLASQHYQNKLAKAIYTGICHYFQDNPVEPITRATTTSTFVTPVINTASKIDENSQTLLNQPTENNYNLPSLPPKTKPVNSLQANVHIVKKNETLFSISKQYGITVSKLRNLNNLSEGQVIYIGQSLKVSEDSTPSLKKDTSVSINKKTQQKVSKKTNKSELVGKNKPTVSKKQITHKVSKGEGLSTIASKYRVKITDLKKVNNIKTNTVRIGQTLKIPMEQ